MLLRRPGHRRALPNVRLRTTSAAGRSAMIFQEPMSSLNPCVHGRQPDCRDGASAPGRVGARRPARHAGLEMLDPGSVSPTPSGPRQGLPAPLSGGMRQRVMIAMALACGPRAAHRRRADDRARRDHPGTDPRAPRATSRRNRHGGPPDHPRSRGRRRLRRPCRASCTPGGVIEQRECSTTSSFAPTSLYRGLLWSRCPKSPVLGQPLTVIPGPGAPRPPQDFATGCRFVARCKLRRANRARTPPP